MGLGTRKGREHIRVSGDEKDQPYPFQSAYYIKQSLDSTLSIDFLLWTYSFGLIQKIFCNPTPSHHRIGFICGEQPILCIEKRSGWLLHVIVLIERVQPVFVFSLAISQLGRENSFDLIHCKKSVIY